MDINELKEDIRNVEYDLEYGEEQNQGRIAVNVNCLRSVIDFANEAIARQSETECKWKCRDDIEYFSECGFHMFRANNYSLGEDGFKYCPKCSKEISDITRYSFDDFVQIED